MTARSAGKIVSVLLALVAGACTNFYEIPIETPIQPKLDVTPFQRVHVVGFIAGGSDDVDANLETVRLLRSQLRTRSNLRVIEADVLPLVEIAQEQAREAQKPEPTSNGTAAPAGPPSGAAGSGDAPAASSGPAQSTAGGSNGGAAHGATAAQGQGGGQPQPLAARIKDEKDLAAYERLFANISYWKKLGEEFQQPLIVTGTVFFTPQQKNGIVTQQQESYDQLGRRVLVPRRIYMERRGFVLRPKFVFIDGRTGATLYTESFREERLYPAQQNTPALSSYFEMMDTLVPSFLNTLSAQKVKGTRVLLK
jgi:hypothetical protein